MAHAMMWVKLTFEAEVAARWRFTRARFSSSARTGISRTEVAVGTESEASMFSTNRTIPPRTGSTTSPGRITGARARERGAREAPAPAELVAIAAGAAAGGRSAIFVSEV